ncbi:hypothetical protein CRE_30939 [Caenorhabditis remanei]|uniref:F-box domain-containing protein n=1 Tax=Caenorhabditis remanei TaxID=31234 RepID=E3LTN5_CAERE|nr:hypothetical protein CRE_30939 [Caenorhabditis remanei]
MATPDILSTLPLRAIQAVLLHFNISDLLSCSRTCLRVCNVAKSLEYEPISLDVDISIYGTSLIFNCNNVCETWSFKESGNTVTVSKKDPPNTIIYGEGSNNVYYSLTSAIIYVTDVLKCTVSKVKIWIQGFKPFMLHNLMELRIEKCLDLQIYIALGETTPVIREQWVAEVIKNVCATGRLYIGVPTDGSFTCDPCHFKCHLLVMDKPTPWLTPEILWKMRCPQMIIKNCPFTLENFLAFVDRWKVTDRRDNRKFEFLDMHFGDLLKKKITDGILRGKSWDKQLRGQYYLTDEEVIDCQNGKDIIHIRDERLMATTLIHKNRKNLFFGVWHNPFPVIPDGILQAPRR